MHLERNPIYHQLCELLRRLVRDGTFQAGAQFLTERQVGEQYGVSRTTANKALSSLVSDGTLEFRKGIGTFVRGAVLGYDLGSLVSFTVKARAAGMKPSTRLLAFKSVRALEAGPEICDGLLVRSDEPLVSMVRVRSANGNPVILEQRYVVQRLCPALSREDAEGSLYAVWTEKYGLRITGAQQRIRAVLLAEDEARRLAAKPPAPALAVTSIGKLETDTPLWWERTIYRGDAYEFQNQLGPVQMARPAVGTLIELGPVRERLRTTKRGGS